MHPPRSRTPANARRAALTTPLAVSLLVHGVMLAAMVLAWRPAGDAPPALAPMVVRMIEWVTPAEPPSDVPKEKAIQRPAAVRPRDARPAGPDVTARPNEQQEADPTEIQPAPVSAGQAPAWTGIDPDSVTRAARQAAGSRSLARESDDILGAARAPSAQERLGHEVARSAKGDCLKGGEGGYDKQGYGLFAIPFLIVDAARGNCRR